MYGRECLFDVPSLNACCPLSYQSVAVILLPCISTVLSLNCQHRIDVVLCTVHKLHTKGQNIYKTVVPNSQRVCSSSSVDTLRAAEGRKI
jgi:hypothetical protein